MAFRQPEAQQSLQRVLSTDEDQRDLPPTQQPLPAAESQTWILFSPAANATASASSLTPTNKSASTAGQSRFSDLGSLQLGGRSNDEAISLRSASYSEVIEDDAELDSLDSHLPEFRAVPNQMQATPHTVPILPAHDGLGSFRLDRQELGAQFQEHLYAFEQFNPRRVRRRRESIELADHDLEGDDAREMDKMRRIEEWRLEQSRFILEEVEKESRRRQLSESRGPRPGPLNKRPEGFFASRAEAQDGEWHDHSNPASSDKSDAGWARTIRAVIRDLIGIDDKVLAVLFGEALPGGDGLSTTPRASQINNADRAVPRQDTAWQDRILARIARELGLLVHRLSDHPGAFSTYIRMQQMPLPYAGLPVIPETAASEHQPGTRSEYAGSISYPQFQPTVQQSAEPIDIPAARQQRSEASVQTGLDYSTATFTQQEWEQDLDIKMVFRYLRSRFTGRAAAQSPAPTTTMSHASISSAQDTAAKVARVRLHHPLVSRARPTERRTFKATTPSSPAALRHGSSCASQSTRRSARRGSGSSRHYWDIGGSVGTGSVIASVGPMGSWGDV